MKLMALVGHIDKPAKGLSFWLFDDEEELKRHIAFWEMSATLYVYLVGKFEEVFYTVEPPRVKLCGVNGNAQTVE